MPSCTKNNHLELKEELNIAKTKVNYICPKCGKWHQLHFLCKGKGVPRKYCSGCKTTSSE